MTAPICIDASRGNGHELSPDVKHLRRTPMKCVRTGLLILLCSTYAAAAGQDHLSFEDRSMASRPAKQWCKDAERINADPKVDAEFKRKFTEQARMVGCYG